MMSAIDDYKSTTAHSLVALTAFTLAATALVGAVTFAPSFVPVESAINFVKAHPFPFGFGSSLVLGYFAIPPAVRGIFRLINVPLEAIGACKENLHRPHKAFPMACNSFLSEAKEALNEGKNAQAQGNKKEAHSNNMEALKLAFCAHYANPKNTKAKALVKELSKQFPDEAKKLKAGLPKNPRAYLNLFRAMYPKI